MPVNVVDKLVVVLNELLDGVLDGGCVLGNGRSVGFADFHIIVERERGSVQGVSIVVEIDLLTVDLKDGVLPLGVAHGAVIVGESQTLCKVAGLYIHPAGSALLVGLNHEAVGEGRICHRHPGVGLVHSAHERGNSGVLINGDLGIVYFQRILPVRIRLKTERVKRGRRIYLV